MDLMCGMIQNRRCRRCLEDKNFQSLQNFPDYAIVCDDFVTFATSEENVKKKDDRSVLTSTVTAVL